MSSIKVSYYPVTCEELPAAIEIEKAGFDDSEAASLESFQYRQRQVPELFLGAYVPAEPPISQGSGPLSTRKLIGYVCSTIASTENLTLQSMKTHISAADGGSSVCIHSVCVDPHYRHQGVAHGLLKEYIRRLEGDDGDQGLKRILLISQPELVGFYQSAGFELVGKSPVEYGRGSWMELRYTLQSQSSDGRSLGAPDTSLEIPTALTPDMLRALSSRNPGTMVQSFTSFASMQDLITDDASRGSQYNKYKLACPRPGCGSTILLKDIAKLVEAASVQLDLPSDVPPASILPPLPQAPQTMEWWLITPNAMQFENIGVSKTVPLPDDPGSMMKLLSCAECDLGPLGWYKVGGTEFWVACSRVGYRV